MAAGTLGVLIPVYNEATWIGQAVEALVAALRAADLTADIVVVDDGSTDDTPAVLADLAGTYGIRVLTQTNQGRLAARRAGLAALDTDYVLMHDARVFAHEDALIALADPIRAGEVLAHNGDVYVRDAANLFVAFSDALVKVGWHRYFRRRERVTVDADTFDVMPKGTGFFLAPRDLLERANTQFTSLFDDPTLVSDDTGLLRAIAHETGYVIDPRFACDYQGRTSATAWATNAYYRGTTFVDSYLGRPGPIRRAALAAGVVGAVGVAAIVRRPRLALPAVVAASGGAAALAKMCGGTARNALALATLGYPFALFFGAGLVRGGILALRSHA